MLSSLGDKPVNSMSLFADVQCHLCGTNNAVKAVVLEPVSLRFLRNLVLRGKKKPEFRLVLGRTIVIRDMSPTKTIVKCTKICRVELGNIY